MYTLIGVIGMLGFFVCLILLFIAMIRRKPKKKIGIGMAVFFLMFMVGGSLLSEEVGPDENVGDGLESVKHKETDKPDLMEDGTINRDSISEHKTSASYKDLLRTPDEYIGEYVVVTVKISQIFETGFFTSTKYYFGHTDESGYEWYFDDEYCFTDARIDDDTKLLEDDILKIYGRFTGVQTFSRALTGTETEIPCVDILYVDILE